MNSIEHLRELFLYNDWANRRIIIGFEKFTERKSAADFVAYFDYRTGILRADFSAKIRPDSISGRNFRLEECSKLAMENAENYEGLIKAFRRRRFGTNRAI